MTLRSYAPGRSGQMGKRVVVRLKSQGDEGLKAARLRPGPRGGGPGGRRGRRSSPRGRSEHGGVGLEASVVATLDRSPAISRRRYLAGQPGREPRSQYLRAAAGQAVQTRASLQIQRISSTRASRSWQRRGYLRSSEGLDMHARVHGTGSRHHVPHPHIRQHESRRPRCVSRSAPSPIASRALARTSSTVSVSAPACSGSREKA